MRYSTFFIFVLLTLTSFLHVDGRPPGENKYVKFSIAMKQRELKAGAKGLLLIELKPQAGIHINLEPPIDLTVEDSSLVRLSEKLTVSKIKKDTSEYLDPSKPIKQSFTVSKHAKPGVARLAGILTYYYCSDADGWCSRFKQPIDMKINVIK